MFAKSLLALIALLATSNATPSPDIVARADMTQCIVNFTTPVTDGTTIVSSFKVPHAGVCYNMIMQNITYVPGDTQVVVPTNAQCGCSIYWYNALQEAPPENCFQNSEIRARADSTAFKCA
ncbi:hypothetical protein FB45DRAFT_1008546 [Roridomyces roridus]|uniref:Uncharacterized protein n=1 Tax=Roridomyces roridus TaxID=1738132 RepID=A0AAD7B9T9_9AGAR|nr:hypothetical protein FB45DRAFT_1008546 [Roridomyces roridus]